MTGQMLCIFLLLWASVCALKPEEAQQFVNSGQFGGHVEISEAQDEFIISSNGLPDHPSEVTSDSALPRVFAYRVPKAPVISEHPGCLPRGPIGITKTGVHIFNPYILAQGNGADRFDQCGGQIDASGLYNYKQTPKKCLMTGTPDELIGVAMDGFPIYGPLATDLNREVQKSDLDQCHGRFVNGEYRYYVTTEFPFFIGCFKGQTKHMPRPLDVLQTACNETSGFDGISQGYLCTCKTTSPGIVPTNIGSFVRTEQGFVVPVSTPLAKMTASATEDQAQIGHQQDLSFNANAGLEPMMTSGVSQGGAVQSFIPDQSNNQIGASSRNGRIINGLLVEGQVGTGLGQMNMPMGPNIGGIINGLAVNQPIGTGLGNGIGQFNPINPRVLVAPPVPALENPVMRMENVFPGVIDGEPVQPAVMPRQFNQVSNGNAQMGTATLTRVLNPDRSTAVIGSQNVNNVLAMPMDPLKHFGFQPNQDGTMRILKQNGQHANPTLVHSPISNTLMPVVGEQGGRMFPDALPSPTLLGFRPTQIGGMKRMVPIEVPNHEGHIFRPLAVPPTNLPTVATTERFEPEHSNGQAPVMRNVQSAPRPTLLGFRPPVTGNSEMAGRMPLNPSGFGMNQPEILRNDVSVNSPVNPLTASKPRFSEQSSGPLGFRPLPDGGKVSLNDSPMNVQVDGTNVSEPNPASFDLFNPGVASVGGFSFPGSGNPFNPTLPVGVLSPLYWFNMYLNM